MSDHLVFFVNGTKVTEFRPDPNENLLHYLRKRLRLTGSKESCGEGRCGACTVMVSKYDRAQKKIRHYSVNACITPVCSLHGLAVTTVEGIGDSKKGFHALQTCLAEAHGIQCGFCTAGMVMSMYTLLRNNSSPSQEDIQVALEGNLCRCTGYRAIIDGFTKATKVCCGGDEGKCPCKDQKKDDKYQETDQGSADKTYMTPDPTQDPIFPPELQMSNASTETTVTFVLGETSWIQPYDLENLLSTKAKFPNSRIIAGGTTIATMQTGRQTDVLLSTSQILELNVLEVTKEGLRIGSALTLGELNTRLCSVVKSLPEWQGRSLKPLQDTLRWLAVDQIRNVATIGGNLLNPATPSDLQPLFLVLNAQLSVQSAVSGKRMFPFHEAVISASPLSALRPDEVLVSITFPFILETSHLISYKQPERRGFDISVVNAALLASFKDDESVVRDLHFVFGGTGFTPVLDIHTSLSHLTGRKWQESLFKDISEVVEKMIGTRDGVSDYQRSLALGFTFKFFLSVGQEIKSVEMTQDSSAVDPMTYIPYETTRVYEQIQEGQQESDPVHRPVPQFCAKQMTCGEAKYIDDTAALEDELFGYPVLSTKSHAKLIKVDESAALALPGIAGYVDHRDVPGRNKWGLIGPSEYVFAEEEVFCYGQMIGMVVAETKELAKKGAEMVIVQYEDLKSVLTIEDAIQADSFFTEDWANPSIVCGDVTAGFAASDHVLEGEVNVGAQEHYYMETHSAIVIPKGEHSEFEVYCTTQNPTRSQMDIASVLAVPLNKVAVHVKRLGGGFGGKDVRNSLLAQPVAVAANKFGRPVRCVLTRRQDMISSGKRPPFKAKYKVGVKRDGTVLSVVVDEYMNAGYAPDIAFAILQLCVIHSDSVYRFPNASYHGKLCRTNLPPNTAFRGFGISEATLMAEIIMNHIATSMGIADKQVREKNFYQEGDTTHSNHILQNVLIWPCWTDCLKQSNYDVRKAEVDKFNRENRWKKRGIAIMPLKFGCGFGASFLSQAGALVQVYRDGSVLLTHGGIEMGQGLHTKMIQIASRVLGIPMHEIHASEISTATVPNTSPTSASINSNLYGMAVMNACKEIMTRLKPLIEANPEGNFKTWAQKAYMKLISLSATGFYRNRYSDEDVGYSFEKYKGKACDYFTYGAGCSEVEIDCLTGEWQILQADMVVDVGKSLNPGIDIGQIEGAFLQGIGQLLLENVTISSDGAVLKDGPGSYKIPSIRNIPRKINVSLLKNSECVHGVYSSKSVGEPPLLLSSSVYLAVKAAIMSARKNAGIEGYFILPCPATVEQIRLACQDQFTKETSSSTYGEGI